VPAASVLPPLRPLRAADRLTLTELKEQGACVTIVTAGGHSPLENLTADQDPQASVRMRRSATLRAHFVSKKEVKRRRKEKRKKKWAAACLEALEVEPCEPACHR